MAFSPPSLEVRKVNKIGVSFKTLRKACAQSCTWAKSNTPSNQSTRHSTISMATSSKDFAAAKISSFVRPTIGTIIFGKPVPISTFFTFTVFIVSLYLIRSLLGMPTFLHSIYSHIRLTQPRNS